MISLTSIIPKKKENKTIKFFLLFPVLCIIKICVMFKGREHKKLGVGRMYKLIALDMDGTLLNEAKEITQENYEAIQAAKANGKQVILATGRPLAGVQRYLEHLDLVSDKDYVVAFNGALVQKTKSGEIISKTPLSIEDYQYLYEISRKLGVHIHALTESYVTTPINNKYTEVEAEINQIPIIEKQLFEIDENETIVKVMFIDEPEILDQAIENMPKEIYEKYTVLRSMPFFLEFLDKRVNKGYGVSQVAEALGIEADQVICVGDAGNDLDMIEYAGLGVAMGNAFEEVKEIANYVTLSNEESGVAHVIKKFMI